MISKLGEPVNLSFENKKSFRERFSIDCIPLIIIS